jgi:hypothetical protein
MGFFSKLLKPESAPTFILKQVNYLADPNLRGLTSGHRNMIKFSLDYINLLLEDYDKEIQVRSTAIREQKRDSKFLLKSNVEYSFFFWSEFRRALTANNVPDIVAYAVTLTLYANVQHVLQAEILQAGYSDVTDLLGQRLDLFANIMNSKNINFQLRERYTPILLHSPISYVTTDVSRPPDSIHVGGLEHMTDSKWVEAYLSILPSHFGSNFQKGISLCR